MNNCCQIFYISHANRDAHMHTGICAVFSEMTKCM